MSERRIYHVIQGDKKDWHVIREGFSRPHITRGTKEEAILMAKRLAKISTPGQVIIHRGKSQAVEGRFTYRPRLQEVEG